MVTGLALVFAVIAASRGHLVMAEIAIAVGRQRPTISLVLESITSSTVDFGIFNDYLADLKAHKHISSISLLCTFAQEVCLPLSR